VEATSRDLHRARRLDRQVALDADHLALQASKPDPHFRVIGQVGPILALLALWELDAPDRGLDLMAPDHVRQVGQGLAILAAGPPDGDSWSQARVGGLERLQVEQGVDLFDAETERKPGMHQARIGDRGQDEVGEDAGRYPALAKGSIQVGGQAGVFAFSQGAARQAHPGRATP